jgi:ribosomal protein S18 acetylase RimI-like enzyme
MNEIVTDLSEAVTRIESNPFAYLINFGRIPQVDLHEGEYLKWITTDAPVGLFNSVFNAQLKSAADIKALISETVSQFTNRERPCVWWVARADQPSDLSNYLTAQGGHLIDTIAMMACPLESLPKQGSTPSSIAIENVRVHELLLTWTDIYCRSRGYDETATKAWHILLGGLALTPAEPLQHYVGYLDGQPAVCASLFLGAGVAGLFNVTTVPDFRHQGLGRAITLHALVDAQKRGFRIAVLGSEAMAHDLYARLGFTDHGQILAYSW